MDDEIVVRGFLASLQVFPPLILHFQFNPASIRDNKEARLVPARREQTGNAPSRCYVGGGDRTIAFRFSLHGLEPHPTIQTGANEGIAPELATLRSFLYPRSDALDLHREVMRATGGRALPAPPTCLFGFGPRLLECWVSSLDIDETQFSELLIPVRADVDITLTVIEEENNPFYQFDHAQRLLFTGLQNVRAGADVGSAIDNLLSGRG
jgi:hypothetical protein